MSRTVSAAEMYLSRSPLAWAQRREPPHLLHAGRAHEARVDEQVVRQHAHQNTAALPARRDQAAKQRRTRGLLVEVHRLRIVFGCEGDDLGAGDDPRTAVGDLAGGKIFPMQAGHGDPCG